MVTTLQGSTQKVEISPEGPTVIIGELLNPTGHSRLAEALRKGDWDLIRPKATSQVGQGAAIIDINVGVMGVDEVVVLPQAVMVISEVVGVPLCLDSANRQALEAALKVCPGKPLINSTAGEEKALTVILPLAKEFGAAVIALCHDEEGIVNDPEKRLRVADKIIRRATGYHLQFRLLQAP